MEVHAVRGAWGVTSTAGGVWLAEIASSDEPDVELDALLADVERRVRGPRPPVLLSHAHGALSSLFAPADPPCERVDGALVWVVNLEAFAAAPDAPRLVQRWLRAIHGWSREGLAQSVIGHGPPTGRARALASLAAGLGLDARLADDGAVAASVHRPEGVVLSALLGRPVDHLTPDRSAATTNDAKDAASAEGRARVEIDERLDLERRLAPDPGRPRVMGVDRAPGLRRLVLAVADGAPDALRALHTHLLVRAVPLMVMVDPRTRAVIPRRFPNGDVLVVYGDRATLFAAARALGMQQGAYAAAELPPPDLFRLAALNKATLALCALRDTGAAMNVLVTPDQVAELAGGRAPTTAE